MLRERGIYRLPNGMQYVASKGPDDMWFLFRLKHWALRGAVGLRVNHDDTISEKGRGTSWTVHDLEDTDQTANLPDGLSYG